MGDRLRLIRLDVVARGEARQGRGTTNTTNGCHAQCPRGLKQGPVWGCWGYGAPCKGTGKTETPEESKGCISAGTENSVMP